MEERNWTSCDEWSRGNLNPVKYMSRTRKLWQWMEFRPFLFLIFRSPAINYTYIVMDESSKAIDTTMFLHILILHSALSSHFISLKKHTNEICLRQCASLTLYKFSRWKETRKNYNIYFLSSCLTGLQMVISCNVLYILRLVYIYFFINIRSALEASYTLNE